MDYVTRQFINLTKKFRRELPEFFQKLNRALDKQTEAIRKSTKSNNEKQTPAPPQIVNTINLPQSIEVHQRENDARQERRYKNRTLTLSLATFLAVAVYAVLVYLQYREMINATGVARATVNEARRNRLQGEKALNASIKQFQLDQRAWIIPRFLESRIEPAPIVEQQSGIIGYISQDAEIENQGKTSASRFHCEFMIISPKVNEIPRFTFPPWTYSADTPVMFPNSSSPFKFTFGMTEDAGDHIHAKPKPVDRALLNGLRDGSVILLVYGRITYWDVFNQGHFIHYCAPQTKFQQQRLIISTPASQTCIAYNQIDK